MRGSSRSKRDTQRDGAMWLPSALLLLSVPGFSSLSGPSTVTGTEGGSLRVQCQYEEKYKTFTKYWCRQPCLLLWNQMVETRGSEGEVRSGRVSIVDHSADLTFTVTLENLTTDDAGKYRCGIATILREEGLNGFLPDLFFQVQVFVSPRMARLCSQGQKAGKRDPGKRSVQDSRSLRTDNMHTRLKGSRVYLQHKEREREPGCGSVPTAGASTLQPAWAVWSHAPQLSCTRIQTPSQ
ncbi:protein CD300H isoform X1 [Panthera tigris]|uniref:protein CD300H isoform X1 n=1 Tax=Panthera tigris TaxID=9694 RepID=UPI001C6F86B6|nr:protein CD300H isoform X1 [Panthera tigris]